MVEERELRKRIPFARPWFGNMEDIGRVADDIERMLIEGSLDNKEVMISNGENCRKLEEEMCRIHGADHAVVTSSCTMAMVIMLGSCLSNRGLKRPWLCQTQSFTWPSTVVSANVQGHELKAHDIDYEHWAVMRYPMAPRRSYALAVDTFGCDACPVSDVPVLYDRAHSLGVRFKHMGIASAISFSPSKLLTAGEGGAVLTNSERFVESLNNTRNIMARMSEVQAMLALHGLKHLTELLDWKKDCFDHYKRAFPQFQFQGGSGNHQVIGMLLRTKEQRDLVLSKVKDKVELKAYYEPVHLKWGDPNLKLQLPVTEDVSRRILCVPSWYGLDVGMVIEEIRRAIEE